MDPDPVRSAEADLAALSDALTRPAPAECLLCFVDRMLTTFGCDGTFRWVRRWRALRVPGATGLERRLGRIGAFCDCELFLNGWTVRDELLVPDEDGAEGGGGGGDRPPDVPGCSGVDPRSTQPCSTWVALRRDR